MGIDISGKILYSFIPSLNFFMNKKKLFTFSNVTYVTIVIIYFVDDIAFVPIIT